MRKKTEMEKPRPVLPEDKTSAIERAVQTDRKPKFSYVLRLWAYVYSSARLMSSLYLGIFILLSFLQPLLAFIWGGYINEAESGAGGDLIPALLLITAYFFINYLVGLIDRYVGLYGGEDIEQLAKIQENRFQELLFKRLYKKIASVPAEYMEIAKINDNIDQVFSFVNGSWDNGVNRGLMLKSYAVAAKAISVLTIAASLYIFNPWLSLIAVIAPLPSLYSMTLGQKLQFKFKKDNTQLNRRLNYFQNLMLSPAGKELKTFGLHDFFYKKWKTLADEYTYKERAMIRTQMALNMVNTTIGSLASVGGGVFAIILMANGQITLGALGAVMVLTNTLVGDTGALLSSFSALFSKKNEAAQFLDLLELPDQRSVGAECGGVSAIQAKNLIYRYPSTDKYVLNDINLTINKGDKVALVGENGAGKTTFIKLVTGTLSPSGGELLINNTPAEAINPVSRYNAASAVVQDPSRYETFTVGDNVYLGDTARRRDETEIEAAMDFSGFTGADKDALLGKDTGGTDLSGGQWQKLAIARAAYRDRDFIILDEPTSNLDPLAEAEIFKKYIALSKDKTVIFVTHRVSVASLADRIIVFKGGKAVQDGSHDELSRSGEYARLYAEQAKWYDR